MICPSCNQEVADGATVCPTDGTPLMAQDPLVGATLGEYQVKVRIGSGGMGIVYEGVQPLIGKRVAIKILKPEIAADPTQVKRLLTEARAVNSIGHRGIIDIFGFGQLPDGRHYIVMEYLVGWPLSAMLASAGNMSPVEAIPLLDEVLSALGAAHAAGIIHRDLKPSNIFLVDQPDRSRFVKLLDFGLAKDLGRDPTKSTQVVGTPEYMAPEQARGLTLTHRVDLYALGVVAFEMLTGRVVFPASTFYQLVKKQMEGHTPRPSSLVPNIPPALDNLVLRLLARDPAERPATAELVRRELKTILRDLKQQGTRGEGFMPPPLLAEPGSRGGVPRPAAARVAALGPEPRSARGAAAEVRPGGGVAVALEPRAAMALGPEPRSKPRAAAALGPEPRSGPRAATALGPEPRSARRVSAEGRPDTGEQRAGVRQPAVAVASPTATEADAEVHTDPGNEVPTHRGAGPKVLADEATPSAAEARALAEAFAHQEDATVLQSRTRLERAAAEGLVPRPDGRGPEPAATGDVLTEPRASLRDVAEEDASSASTVIQPNTLHARLEPTPELPTIPKAHPALTLAPGGAFPDLPQTEPGIARRQTTDVKLPRPDAVDFPEHRTQRELPRLPAGRRSMWLGLAMAVTALAGLAWWVLNR